MPDLFLLSLGESRQEALTGKCGAAEAGWHARLEPGATLPRRVVLWLQRLFFFFVIINMQLVCPNPGH